MPKFILYKPSPTGTPGKTVSILCEMPSKIVNGKDLYLKINKIELSDELKVTQCDLKIMNGDDVIKTIPLFIPKTRFFFRKAVKLSKFDPSINQIQLTFLLEVHSANSDAERRDILLAIKDIEDNPVPRIDINNEKREESSVQQINKVQLSPPGYSNEIGNEDFWQIIKDRTIDFNEYKEIMDSIMACDLPVVDSVNIFKSGKDKQSFRNRLPFLGANSYSLLKFATEAYVKKLCTLGADDINSDYFTSTGLLPYIDLVYEKISEYEIRKDNKDCFDTNDIIKSRMSPIFLELIWSYWHEEGKLAGTMDAISSRFQNIRGRGPDPMARLDIDPLRPLNNILWGYVQDTQHRLNSTRRIYEYDHHYGLMLADGQMPVNSVDSRSKFIEAFHNLLYKASIYYKDVDDMTRRPDGFQILNALKEVHMILAENAHNQFGDLPTTARAEMLVEQWILARPEMREFLGGKIMVPYTEPWMDKVDTVKNMQGWTDTSVSYFHKLGKYGEQLLLSIRYDNWSEIDDAAAAGSWAVFWRNEVQQYIHSYFAATGVDLSIDSLGNNADKFMLPSIMLQKKIQYRISANARYARVR
ncbi:MAG: hypothetical protein JNK43_05095 [Ignavibacteria bacterium]|nr:hypothetical protein [Ignavibacteria bacterium]